MIMLAVMTVLKHMFQEALEGLEVLEEMGRQLVVKVKGHQSIPRVSLVGVFCIEPEFSFRREHIQLASNICISLTIIQHLLISSLEVRILGIM